MFKELEKKLETAKNLLKAFENMDKNYKEGKNDDAFGSIQQLYNTDDNYSEYLYYNGTVDAIYKDCKIDELNEFIFDRKKLKESINTLIGICNYIVELNKKLLPSKCLSNENYKKVVKKLAALPGYFKPEDIQKTINDYERIKMSAEQKIDKGEKGIWITTLFDIENGLDPLYWSEPHLELFKSFLNKACNNAKEMGFKVDQWVTYKDTVERIIKQCEITKNFIKDICFYHNTNPSIKKSNDEKEQKAYDDYTEIIEGFDDLDENTSGYTIQCDKLRKFVHENKSNIDNYILKNGLDENLSEESLANFEKD